MPNLPPAPFGAASASEWLSDAAARLTASASPEVASWLAQIAFLTASLERRYHLPELTDAMLGDLLAPLSRLPRQLVHLPATHPAARWFQLAALAEHHGEPHLARLVTNALAYTLGEHDPARALECGFAPEERDELLALCLCRRGRVSRTAGALLDAQYHFEDARALVADRPWRDARIAVELGLVNIAVSRGNYPFVAERCSSLLSDSTVAAAMGDIHRVALLQMRAIALRKRGALLEALLDSWQAYDLLGSASEHRAELVVSMAETALEAGDVRAAQAGFASALHEAQRTHAAPRVLSAAITGQARAAIAEAALASAPVANASLPMEASRAGAPHRLARAAASLLTLLEQPLAPRERVYALVTLAECRLVEHRRADARTLLQEAMELATARHFHDHVFRIEALTEQLSAKTASEGGCSVFSSSPSTDAGHPALGRLHTLAAV